MRIFIFSMIAMALAACGGEQKTSDVQVILETSKGDIVVALYPDKAPITVANFLRYVDEGQYQGAYFYRTTRPDNDPMIEVIQGGLWAPWKEDGDGNFEAPLPSIAHETTAVTGLSHSDGAISMARVEPGTASSEFFISVGDNLELDYEGLRNPDGQGFAVFGAVIKGMDLVREINAASTQEGEGFAGQLLAEPVEILSVKRK